MAVRQIAISIDHNFRYPITADPLANFMKVDCFRRLLDEQFNIKQVGAGLFIATSTDKDSIYNFLEHQEESGMYSDLTVKLYLVESLEENFKDWKSAIVKETFLKQRSL